MAVFVVAHGAWSAGWAWKKMRPLLRDAGHELFTPSYTGLGEREHLASRDVNLTMHVEDLLRVLQFEDLTEVVLIGHSFGGMVATGVADRAPDRVGQIVYLDAFIPSNGDCLFDLVSAPARARMLEGCREGDGWRVPPLDLPADTPEAERVWAVRRRTPHPAGAFEEPLRLSGRPLPARAYVYCARASAQDTFRRFAERARAEGWPCIEMDASHNPHITAPEALRDVLDEVVRPS
jgi:pimeloyl-ACP methyl ester carboxylesterase